MYVESKTTILSKLSAECVQGAVWVRSREGNEDVILGISASGEQQKPSPELCYVVK